MREPVAPLEQALDLITVTHLLEGRGERSLLSALADLEDPERRTRQEHNSLSHVRSAYQWAVEKNGCRDHPGKDPAMVLVDTAETVQGLFSHVGIPDHLDDHTAFESARALRDVLVWLVVTRGYVTTHNRLHVAVAEARVLIDGWADKAATA